MTGIRCESPGIVRLTSPPIPWVASRIKTIMLLSGVLTATMAYAVIASDAALPSTLGETLDGPVANIIVRNWGALIGLVGGMLAKFAPINFIARPVDALAIGVGSDRDSDQPVGAPVRGMCRLSSIPNHARTIVEGARLA